MQLYLTGSAKPIHNWILTSDSLSHHTNIRGRGRRAKQGSAQVSLQFAKTKSCSCETGLSESYLRRVAAKEMSRELPYLDIRQRPLCPFQVFHKPRRLIEVAVLFLFF